MAKQSKATEVEAVETTSTDVNPIIRDGITLEQIQKDHETKSSAIRYLAGKGYERKHIAKFMGIRYQHVRNVLTTILKGDSKTEAKTD